MAQLLVRNLDEAVVRELRAEAAREKISVEEAHRRVLQRALLPEPEKPEPNFLDYLAQMPIAEGDEFIFERRKDPMRPAPDLED